VPAWPGFFGPHDTTPAATKQTERMSTDKVSVIFWPAVFGRARVARGQLVEAGSRQWAAATAAAKAKKANKTNQPRSSPNADPPEP